MYPSFHVLGLLTDDQAFHMIMKDAAEQRLPQQLRDLFMVLMNFTDVSDPHRLYDSFKNAMAKDFKH